MRLRFYFNQLDVITGYGHANIDDLKITEELPGWKFHPHFKNQLANENGRLLLKIDTQWDGALRNGIAINNKGSLHTLTFDAEFVALNGATVYVGIDESDNGTSGWSAVDHMAWSSSPQANQEYIIDFIPTKDYVRLYISTWTATANITAPTEVYFDNFKLTDGTTAAITDGGVGNKVAFKFRIHDASIGRFLSVDPLSKAYPMLSPYQFAANMPIWAKDIEGTEAIIMNKNDNTATFVGNIFVVSQGGGKVSKTELKKATDRLIVKQLSKEARTLNGVEYRFELNYITEDLDGNPLTYESAAELAKESKVTHITSDDEEIIIEGPETGVVVASENATDQVEFSGNDNGQFIEHSINEDGPFNAIFLNEDLNKAFDQRKLGQSFAHEMGHFLGFRRFGGPEIDPKKFNHSPRGGIDPGITSRRFENIRLVPNDLKKMTLGSFMFGKRVTTGNSNSQEEE